MNKETKIIFSVSLILIIVAVLLAASGSKPATLASQTVDASVLVKSTNHMTGTTTAKVTVVEFGDYECPACGVAEPIMEQLIAAYGKNQNFNFVFRNFPLPQHANAQVAAEAAEAAGAQGKFWQMHDLLYKNQNAWSDSANPIDMFTSYAAQIGLDIIKFKSDVASNAYASIITADQADGSTAGLSWTPSIYVNGILLQTMPSFTDLKAQIDSLLK